MLNKVILILALLGFASAKANAGLAAISSHSTTTALVEIFQAIHSGPPAGPEPSGTSGILLEDDKNKTSIWKNLWSYYKKCKEWAKTYVSSLNAVSDLLYGTYEMLKKWEDISKKVEFLTSTNPFDGSGVVDRIENAEGWFRTSDQLFFEDVPTAMKKREMLSKQANALVGSFRGGSNATIGSAGKGVRRELPEGLPDRKRCLEIARQGWANLHVGRGRDASTDHQAERHRHGQAS